MTSIDELPVAAILPELLAQLREHPRVILRAPPGAGKTTVVPLACKKAQLSAGPIWLTQPRRLAARGVAARMSQLNGTELGRDIGYQVRWERRWQKSTRIVAATTGVVLRRLLSDPFLEETTLVILDEFHERTLELDLLLGLLIRLQQTVRPDLKILIMSATLDCGPLAEFLQAPVVESPGRMFPVEIRYQRQTTREPLEQQIAAVLPGALTATPGDLLVFLPGVGEIFRTQRAIEPWTRAQGIDVLPLYGDLPLSDQDRVLQPSPHRKLILSTNVAETSLTIDGVTGVIDSGLVRVLRYDSAVGLSRLVLESHSQASAEQRAGRAGRQAPGVCWRLWPESLQRTRAPFDTPEIHRGDLSAALLQLAGLGETDFADFPWLTPPTPNGLATAEKLLQSLGACAGRQVTDLGRWLLQVPATPRMAKLLWSSHRYGVAERGALAAALLTERDPFRVNRHRPGTRGPVDRTPTRGNSDLVERVQRLEHVLAGGSDPDLHPGALTAIRQSAHFLQQSLAGRAEEEGGPEQSGAGDPGQLSRHASESPRGREANRVAQEDPADTALRRAVWEAYPDRLVKRRSAGSDRGVMVGGVGVQLSPDSGVLDAELWVAVDVEHRDRDSLVRWASAVDLEWLDPDSLPTADEYFFHPTQRAVHARRRRYFQDLAISESPLAASDLNAVREVLYPQIIARWDSLQPQRQPEVANWLARVEFLRRNFPDDGWPELTDEALQRWAWDVCYGCQKWEEVQQAPWLMHLPSLLPGDLVGRLEALAPSDWRAPSGNRVSITYEPGAPPKLSVRMQELFGLAETPRIAQGRVPLLLELLGPNYRPQQLTSDLPSFWTNTYPQVRKELARRYPKHHWPEDPRQAPATRTGLKRDIPS